MQAKASDFIQYWHNSDGPTIGSAYKGAKCQEGLYFRNLSDKPDLQVYEDWRNTAAQRAAALEQVLTVEQKIGLLFVDSLRMGISQPNMELRDASGLLDEEVVEEGKSIFNDEKTFGTTVPIRDHGLRHFIIRDNPSAGELVDWINQLNALAERQPNSIPVLLVSNSRNENGEVVFGMNDAAGVFPAWPGSLGIAAALLGSGDDTIIDTFADCIRRDWDATGIKKGYMYMADVVTDPRWQRTYGTFGEDPALIGRIMERLIPGIQGSDHGVTADGVSVTIKHFPGGGARENGFDPHYAQGQWNVYATEGSLEKYHLPPFRAAIKHNPQSIMPYYAKPAAEKSAVQYDDYGNPIPFEAVGFAYNRFFIQELLREQMGFQGYVNSDSGITMSMAWGLEAYDIPHRIAMAVNNGIDLISGSFDVTSAKCAWDQGLIQPEALTRAVSRTLEEMFALGLFDNPYRDAAQAAQIVNDPRDWENAYAVHQKSVVLLKNNRGLPVSLGQKLYVEGLKADAEKAVGLTEHLRKTVRDYGYCLADTPQDADAAFIYCEPASGNYFNATMGYLELDLCDGKTVCDVDDNGCPADTTHKECTLANVDRVRQISQIMHEQNKPVIAAVNFPLAWLLGNVEPYADVLAAGFDTYPRAILDVLSGKVSPVGKLPLTLPRNDAVIAVNKHGRCISPNDVPGYDKDSYMPESMKDENGKAYAYRDSEGHYYELGFGLGNG